MAQTDRHKNIPVSVRLEPPDLKARLDAHLELTGQSRNSFILQAIEAKLDSEAPAS